MRSKGTSKSSSRSKGTSKDYERMRHHIWFLTRQGWPNQVIRSTLRSLCDVNTMTHGCGSPARLTPGLTSRRSPGRKLHVLLHGCGSPARFTPVLTPPRSLRERSGVAADRKPSSTDASFAQRSVRELSASVARAPHFSQALARRSHVRLLCVPKLLARTLVLKSVNI